jgi:hypothetical protein
MTESELAVVHLVRRANGIEPFERFIESYRRHPAGMPHELVLVLKGFDGDASTEPYRRHASALGGRWLVMDDYGFDLGSYRRAASELAHRRLLFINSFSVILADDWLALLAAAESEARIGAVAASGSWGSRASHVRYHNRLGGPYARVFPDQAVTSRVFAQLTSENTEPAPNAAVTASAAPLAARLTGPMRALAHVAREAIQFAQFPCPHLRTNGLLIERKLWLEVCPLSPRDKLTAHRLESGRRGITARLRAAGLHVAIVGRDGRSYTSDEWPASVTYWQGNQENLLIGDNQTRSYQEGDALRRRVLAGYAWGEQAAPALPRLSPLEDRA